MNRNHQICKSVLLHQIGPVQIINMDCYGFASTGLYSKDIGDVPDVIVLQNMTHRWLRDEHLFGGTGYI